MKRARNHSPEKKKAKKEAAGLTIVKGTKKNVPRRDPAGPRLPLSPFMFFCKDWRCRIQEANPGASIPEQNKLLGSKWKELGEDAKIIYHDRAKEDKLRYDLQMTQFQAKKAAEATVEVVGTPPLPIEVKSAS